MEKVTSKLDRQTVDHSVLHSASPVSQPDLPSEAGRGLLRTAPVRSQICQMPSAFLSICIEGRVTPRAVNNEHCGKQDPESFFLCQYSKCNLFIFHTHTEFRKLLACHWGTGGLCCNWIRPTRVGNGSILSSRCTFLHNVLFGFFSFALGSRSHFHSYHTAGNVLRGHSLMRKGHSI